MRYFKLKEDEVILYEGRITHKDGVEFDARIYITNYSIVTVTVDKKDDGVEVVDVCAIGAEKVKIYKGKPWVKRNMRRVEIFTTEGEVLFKFPSTIESGKFSRRLVELLTGKTAVERGFEKVKDTMEMVGDSIGINPTEIVKTVANESAKQLPKKILGDNNKK